MSNSPPTYNPRSLGPEPVPEDKDAKVVLIVAGMALVSVCECNGKSPFPGSVRAITVDTVSGRVDVCNACGGVR